MTALKLDHIYKDFSGLEVLVDISMTVEEGERHAVIGPNGAGKSTLFNIITGHYRPSRGKIHIMGRDSTGWSAHKIARMSLSRSFQVINNFPKMTVFENVPECHCFQGGSAFQCRLLSQSIRKDPSPDRGSSGTAGHV